MYFRSENLENMTTTTSRKSMLIRMKSELRCSGKVFETIKHFISKKAAIKKKQKRTYYKFTVVRDPIERILSAYKDKAHEEFRGKAGAKVQELLKSQNRTKDFEEYDIESFHAFVQERGEKFNDHFEIKREITVSR